MIWRGGERVSQSADVLTEDEENDDDDAAADVGWFRDTRELKK